MKMRTVTIHDEAIRSNPFRNAVNPFKHDAYSNVQQTSILLVTTNIKIMLYNLSRNVKCELGKS